jgi:hypothetical protein
VILILEAVGVEKFEHGSKGAIEKIVSSRYSDATKNCLLLRGAGTGHWVN